MRARSIGLAALVAVLLTATLPTVVAFHGASWRARQLEASYPDYGIDHSDHPNSTATNVETGETFLVDLDYVADAAGQWDGDVTINITDPDTGDVVHEATFSVVEDTSGVEWWDCFEATDDPDDDLEVLPDYGMASPSFDDPSVLEVGPGTDNGTGIMRNSFCNDQNVDDDGDKVENDKAYWKAFSDYTGLYTECGEDGHHCPGTPPCRVAGVGVPSETVCELLGQDPPKEDPATYRLHLHVRWLDHG